MKLDTLIKSAIFGAILCVVQITFSSVPFELVTPLIVIYAASLSFKKTLCSILVFCILNAFIWGLQIYTMFYFILFPLIGIIAFLLFQKNKNEYIIAFFVFMIIILSGVFWAFVNSLFLQKTVLINYYLAGFIFDLIHGLSTFIVTLFITKPLLNFLKKMEDRL